MQGIELKQVGKDTVGIPTIGYPLYILISIKILKRNYYLTKSTAYF